MIFELSRKSKVVAIIFILFALIFSSISLVNHYLLRTYSFDLGMFNQALYSFAHFKMNYFTLDQNGNAVNYFGDHFAPITLLLAPLYYLGGTYTLLVVQILFVLIGGWGVYRYASLHYSNSYIPVIILVQFFGIWGIYSALSYDFHTNVLAAMLVPWLIYYHERTNTRAFLLMFLLILIAKENMALWLFFILLGLALKKIAQGSFKGEIRKLLKLEIPLMIFTVIYFIATVGYIMPYLSGTIHANPMNRYADLGNNLSEIVSNIFLHPGHVISLLFESPLKEQYTFGIKMELHLMVLVSGGFALLFRPYYLVMLIPIYAQKLFANNYAFWGINGQYSIEFVPILSLCLADFLLKIKSSKLAMAIAIATTVTTIGFNIDRMESRRSVWYNRTNTAFYAKQHYQSPLNVNAIKEELATIPDEVPVSVSAPLAPWLASRDKLYSFPVVKDAAYLVLLRTSTYPLSEEDFAKTLTEYMHSANYTLLYNKNALVIFKKRGEGS